MPRRAFVADLQAAASSSLPVGLFDLKQADEDGSFTVCFNPSTPGSPVIRLQVTIAVDDYPAAHTAFVFVTTDGAPSFVEKAVADYSQFEGMKVMQIISQIAILLRESHSGSQENPLSLDSDDNFVDFSDNEPELHTDSSDDNDYDDFDDDAFGGAADGSKSTPMSASKPPSSRLSPAEMRELDTRIRSDLQLLKSAGFHVSCHGSPFAGTINCYLTISCRISKLNISDDALQAWGLVPEKYFLFVIHYSNGYRTMEQILTDMANFGNRNYAIEFRTAVCPYRKAPRDEIAQLFAPSDAKRRTSDADEFSSATPCRLERYFIDRPMNELLNGRFLGILHARQTMNLHWTGAERFCQDNQAVTADNHQRDPAYWNVEGTLWPTMPSLQISDHFSSQLPHRSFPLIAMEFTLRHLARCTEFCLVCHTKLEVNFEALKPYVCSKPLCLYQYMTLGFGPTIEHEILTQPSVVDLLVSFCYSRTACQKLTDLPVGMGIDLPNPNLAAAKWKGSSTLEKVSMKGNAYRPALPDDAILATYNSEREHLVFDKDPMPKLRKGDWLAIRRLIWDESKSKVSDVLVYRKVLDQLHGVSAELSKPTGTTVPPGEVRCLALYHNTSLATDESDSKHVVVGVYLFSEKFDLLERRAQLSSICNFLDALPSVSEMRDAIIANRDKNLMQLFPCTPAASFMLLRWVIASNRSCIVALDDLSSPSINYKDRVAGMPGYLQFRFAQGAPDKEQRFVQAVKSVQIRTKKAHPTLWAWHGSPLVNWHSIIREGLHYKETSHGRAYGNGVYHALNVDVSTGYMGPHRGNTATGTNQGQWTKSQLRINGAVSLNEIVNDPPSFISKSPYLVVQHVDWIQTRYLFVSTALTGDQTLCLKDEATPALVGNELRQDPAFPIRGKQGGNIVLPANASSSLQRKPTSSPKHMSNVLLKKMPILGRLRRDGVAVEDDANLSDATDEEDLALIRAPKQDIYVDLTAEDDSGNSPPGTKRTSLGDGRLADSCKAAKLSSPPQTDFVPGTLDITSLPMLPPPPYATPAANKALARELKTLQKTQSGTAPAELGWHLCEEALDNIYQWIVELHTFDASLPLSRDLKAKGLTSVVLEMRFGPQFPFSPPFVRVVRPRFLDFRAGGGGHVTYGGAMCMQLLTNDGWSAASSIEAVLLQVRLAISSTDPQPARLPAGPHVGAYSASEAMAAYKRACILHGWTIPPDFHHIERQTG